MQEISKEFEDMDSTGFNREEIDELFGESEEISEDNFDVVFYGENGSNDDYGVKVDPTVNNKEMVQKYSKKFFGLYGELLTCDYRLELDKQDSEKHVDYMVKNSWYKIKTDENQLLKICNQ